MNGDVMTNGDIVSNKYLRFFIEAVKHCSVLYVYPVANGYRIYIATQYGKLGGAAQRRFTPAEGGPGAILHHVTLAYDIDAEKMGRVLNTSREKMSDKAVKSAVKRVDPMRSQTGMSREDVVERLLDAARRVTM